MSRRKRGKCDYCWCVRLLDPNTKFCLECEERFAETVDKHFDGNPLEPLEIIAELLAHKESGK